MSRARNVPPAGIEGVHLPASWEPSVQREQPERIRSGRRRPRRRLSILGLVVLVCAFTVAIASPPAAAADDDADVTVTEPRVDLNQASVDALCSLPGIGRKKAEAILALREKRPFTRVTQLLQVKGIGPKTLHKLKPRIVIGLANHPPQAPSPALAPALSTRR
jgi:competence protein ComEA